jgi:hypothetical protein
MYCSLSGYQVDDSAIARPRTVLLISKTNRCWVHPCNTVISYTFCLHDILLQIYNLLTDDYSCTKRDIKQNTLPYSLKHFYISSNLNLVKG